MCERIPTLSVWSLRVSHFVLAIMVFLPAAHSSVLGASPSEVEAFIRENENYAASIANYECDFEDVATEAQEDGGVGKTLKVSRKGTLVVQEQGVRLTTEYIMQNSGDSSQNQHSVILLRNPEYLFYRQNEIALSKAIYHDSRGRLLDEARGIWKVYMPDAISACTHLHGGQLSLREYLESCKPAWKNAKIESDRELLTLNMIEKGNSVFQISLDLSAGGPIVHYVDFHKGTKEKHNETRVQLSEENTGGDGGRYPATVSRWRYHPQASSDTDIAASYVANISSFHSKPAHPREYFYLEGLSEFENTGREHLLEIRKNEEPIRKTYRNGAWQTDSSPGGSAQRRKTAAQLPSGKSKVILYMSGIALIVGGALLAIRKGLSRS